VLPNLLTANSDSDKQLLNSQVINAKDLVGLENLRGLKDLVGFGNLRGLKDLVGFGKPTRSIGLSGY